MNVLTFYTNIHQSVV